MNGFFIGNIAFIRQYNKSLADKLANTQLKQFELNTNLAGEYNILIDSKPVHSVTGALSEAEEIFNKKEHDTKNVIHVIYGMGLGYLFDKFASDAKGDVILYEPDLALLRFIFEIIDMSEILKKNNVFVVSDYEELTGICSLLFKYKRQILSYSLDFYKSSRHEILFCFHEYLKKLYEELYRNHFFQTNKIPSYLPEMLKSLEIKAQKPLFNELKDKFKDKPAIIVSAGPSLAENIEILKKYKNKAVIFAVGTALKVLLEHGIEPDFVNYIETYSSESFFEGVETSRLNLVAEPYTAQDVFMKKFKNIFLTTSYESNVNHLFAELCGFELPYFESKGTVAYQALYCAKTAGCSPIILLGQDLAYTDGKCYVKGSIYEDLKCVLTPDGYKIEVEDKEKLKKAYFASMPQKTDDEKEELFSKTLENLNNSLCTVNGINGEMLPTSVDYKNFISYFEYFAAKNKEIKLYNASNGAKIKGYEHISAEFILKDLTEKPDVDFVINSLKPAPRATSILESNIKKDISVLKKAVAFLKEYNAYATSKNVELDKLLKIYNDYRPVRMTSLILSIATLMFYNKTEYLLRDEVNYNDPDFFLRILRGFGGNGLWYCERALELLEESLRNINESRNTTC